MGDWSLGSIADEIFNLVDDIPSSISGTTLLNLIDQRRIFVEKYLDVTIGSNAITDIYKGPISELSRAKLLVAIETQGTDASDIKLGEFNIKKGSDSASLSSAKAIQENAMQDLKILKGKAGFFKALG